ncbi:MAG: AgmX/PglI C-terminal domain-containing protein [Myxococcales bacterium]|nr:AgmX/PglI C-terminal domain-containing protein [Myxococcales bacterium]
MPDAAPPSSTPPCPTPRRTPRRPPSPPGPPRAPGRRAPSPRPRPRWKTEAATGALAALDRGRVEAPVEKVEAPAEVEELPDTLEQRTISGVIKTNKRGVEGCYQRQLKRDPTMRQASIKLRFNIERTGQTSNVVLDEKYKGTELAACLERLVRRWRFPAFKGEAIPVEYPVLFHTSL